MFKDELLFLLPTEGKTNIYRSNLTKNLGLLKKIKFQLADNSRKLIDCTPNFQLDSKDCVGQYLYICSEDPKDIIEGSLILYKDIVGIYHYDSINLTHDIYIENQGKRYPFIDKSYFKKITASTDTSLKLPTLPLRFLEFFIDCFNHGICKKEVKVMYGSLEKLYKEKLYINHKNEINIRIACID